MSEMKKLNFLVARNIKLYFKDKMMFFCSLITPLILIVLFLTFLGNTYKESLINCLPQGVELGESLINAFTGGWLFSSILATSCITVAICSSMMITDKINKVNQDFQITPAKQTTILTSYTIANFITTLIICMVAVLISFIYLSIVGWYLSFVDVLMLLGNMLLTIALGTVISSLVGLFISSQGGLSAVCTLISSMYGFICGAYMPIASFGAGIQGFVSLMPGTYATVLFRQAYMNGVLDKIGETLPPEVINKIREGFDGTFYFFGNEVPTWAMFLIVAGSVVLLFGLYILLAYLKNRKPKHKKDAK